MRDDDRVRILHMIDVAESVQQFVAGRKRADLDADRMLLFALLRAVEVIGEAASKVTGETQRASPSIPGFSVKDRACPARGRRVPWSRGAPPDSPSSGSHASGVPSSLRSDPPVAPPPAALSPAHADRPVEVQGLFELPEETVAFSCRQTGVHLEQ